MFRKLTMQELDRPDLATYQAAQKHKLVVILDNVRSGLNVGSALRTSDAFAVEQVALCGITVQPPHKEILKTALGSAHSVDWRYFGTTPEAIQQYQSDGYTVLAVEQAIPCTLLQDYTFDLASGKYAFVFGNEVDGVGEDALAVCDGVLQIPQFGTKHSLNVAVTVGLVLWEAVRQGASTTDIGL